MRAWQVLGVTVALAATLVIAFVLFGSQSRHAAANPVSGLVSVSAGEGQTCAVTTTASVKCWGYSGSDGSLSLVPVDVSGLSDIVDVQEGYFFACALNASGGVVCWGDNYFGRLGNGNEISTATPAGVTGLGSGVTQIGVGYDHVCALLSSGTVRCWGGNGYGELGNGTTMYSSTPVAVVGLSGVKYVGAGYGHSCAITADGAVWCWGRNGSGQLGDGTAQSRMTPVPVLGLEGAAVAVTGSNDSTCALLTDGTVKCWGLHYGASPVAVAGLDDVVAIDSGLTHTCVVTGAGAAKCWGTNGTGELGDGQACGSSSCSTPTAVVGLDSGVAGVSSGSLYSCAVLTNGSAKCWGTNTYGQLGSGEAGWNDQSSVPLDVVEEVVKPTPTRTPCPVGGCPTPTPRPIPPLTGVDFSIAIDIDGDGTPECGTGADQPHGCVIPPASNFNVIVNLNALDASPGTYDGFDVVLQSDGVQTQGSWLTFWPDCAFSAQAVEATVFRAGCAIGVDAKPSTYVGQLVSVRFDCNETGSITLDQSNDPGSTDVVDDGLQRHYENGDEVLHIVCGALERGDDNCDSEVNAVDATLTLQYDAAIVPHVDCQQQSDVNLDSQTNAIDAGLTLQYDATLIDTLPPNQLR